MAKKTIILVDPCSSRLSFIDEITKAGHNPVCVFPFHAYDESYESMCYKNEVSDIKSICRAKATVIEAPENMEDLMPMLSGYDVLGVINCSDSAAGYSDRLAEMVKCPLNPPATSEVRVDKFLMQAAVKEYGLRCIETALVDSEEDVNRFWNEHGLRKAVVKPARSGGMKGVHVCESPSEAMVAAYSLKNDSDETGTKNKRIVIQEFIEGAHYFFNTVSVDGVHRVMQTWIVESGLNRQGIHRTTYMTLPLYPNGFGSVVKYLCGVLDALDFRNGVAQTEIMVDTKGPVLMELNPRMMKFYVDPEIQDLALGNHNSDIAIFAMTNPEKFLKEWVSFGTIRPVMIKELNSIVEGPRYVKPADTLLRMSKGIVKCRIDIPTEGMVDMKRTTSRELAPGFVQIYSDNVSDFFGYVLNHQVIEWRYPDLLWDPVEKHEACGFASDINDIASEIKGKTVAVLNDIGVLEWRDGKFTTADESKKYGYGAIVLGGEFRLDERYVKIKKFTEMIKDGGNMYALPSSYQNMPYGATGMETFLNQIGCQIHMPMDGRDMVVRCTVRH